MSSQLEQIYNTMTELNRLTDNFAHWSFVDLYEALPAHMKLKQDPRPLAGKEKDWQFSDFIEQRQRDGIYITKPADVDLSRYVTFPPQQQLIGSCAGESAANIIERLINEHSGSAAQRGITLSGQFIYWCAEQLDEHEQEGTYLWAACEALRHYGVCLNHLLPEKATYKELIESKPSEQAFNDAHIRRISAYYQTNNVEDMSIALQMGYGVQLAIMCHTGWNSAIIEKKTRQESYMGAHAVEVDGIFLDKGFVKIHNSWGIGGDGTGHHLIRMDYFKEHFIDARIIVR